MEIFLYFLLGTFSGVLAGLFGIGGGIIIIPTYFFIFSYLGFADEILSHMVLGSSLGVIVFSSIASTFSHNIKESVDWRLIRIVAPSIIVGSALGGITAGLIESSTLQGLVALFLVVASVQLIFEFPPPPQNPRTNLIGPVVAGGGIGWLSGVFGIGGGIFLSPILFLIRAGKPKHIVTAASLFILINSVFGIVGQLTKSIVLGEISNYWYLFLVVIVCLLYTSDAADE